MANRKTPPAQTRNLFKKFQTRFVRLNLRHILVAGAGAVVLAVISGIANSAYNDIFHPPVPTSTATPTATVSPTPMPTLIVTSTAIVMSAQQAVHTLAGFSGFPTSVVFLPDSKQLLSVSDDGTAYHWDVENGTLISHATPNGSANMAAYTNPAIRTSGMYKITLSPNQNAFTIGGPDMLVSYRINDGTSLFATPVDAPVTSLIYTQNGVMIFAAMRNMNILAVSATDSHPFTTFTYPKGSVYGFALNKDSSMALSGADDAAVHLWQLDKIKLTSPTQIREYPGLTGTVNSVAFAPDGKSVLAGSYGKGVQLWDLESGVPIRSFTGHTGSVNVVGFLPDQKDIFSASDDGTLRIWEITTGREVCRIDLKAKIVDAAVSPNGHYLITASAPLENASNGTPAQNTGTLLVYDTCV